MHIFNISLETYQLLVLYYVLLQDVFQGQFYACLNISLSDIHFHTFLPPFVPFILISDLCWLWKPETAIHHMLFERKVIHSLSAPGLWTSVLEYDLTFK